MLKESSLARTVYCLVVLTSPEGNCLSSASSMPIATLSAIAGLAEVLKMFMNTDTMDLLVGVNPLRYNLKSG